LIQVRSRVITDHLNLMKFMKPGQLSPSFSPTVYRVSVSVNRPDSMNTGCSRPSSSEICELSRPHSRRSSRYSAQHRLFEPSMSQRRQSFRRMLLFSGKLSDRSHNLREVRHKSSIIASQSDERLCRAWGPAQQAAFEKVKSILSSAPVIRTFDVAKEAIIQTDVYRVSVSVNRPDSMNTGCSRPSSSEICEITKPQPHDTRLVRRNSWR
jgi:hypothetical protein